jgi:proteasome assembly chaperone (PAC2) family protein
MYATRIQNPVAAVAVLGALTKMLDIEIDITELADVARETADRMKQMADEAMEDYIDHFTQPIWEQGEEEEE